MKEDSKCCNPLVAVIVFLVATIVVILGALIVMRLRAEPTETVRTVEKLVMPRRNETETETTTSTSTSKSRITTTASKPGARSKAPRNVCESPECITLAHQMNNWGNPKVDPCDDFFEYACGKYAEHTDTDGSRYLEKDDIIDGLTKEFLLKNKPTDSPSEKAMHLLYRKCEELKDPAVYKKKAKKINGEILKNLQKIGSWPVIDPKWDAKKFDLNKVLSKMASLHVSNFGFFNVHIGPSNLATISTKKKKERDEEQFLASFQSFLKQQKINFNQTSLVANFNDFIGMEKVIEKSKKKRSTKKKHLVKLRKAVPSINFKKIIKKMGNLSNDGWQKVNKIVMVKDIELFFGTGKRSLEHIIKKTDPRVVANFLMFQFYEEETRTLDLRSKFISCHRIVLEIMPDAVYRMFVNRHFDDENLKAAVEIVNRTEQSYVEMFRESTWLSESTRRAAIRKVQKMKRTIGHTDDYAQKSVEERYRKLNFKDTNTIYAMTSKVWRSRQVEHLGFIVSDAKATPRWNLLESNAFYRRTNEFFFMVPFLDEPYFDVTLPEYAKLASVGFVMAHEIGHGYDADGRMYDAFGNETSWWDAEDLKEYNTRTDCLVSLTSNYDDPVYGKTLNGVELIDEVIADVLAMETNWRTLNRGDYAGEPRIIGFEEQSIERSYIHLMALNHCAPWMKPEKGPISHPTGSFRVNAIYSNSKVFAEAYQCPVGSPMNPEKKCELF